MKPGKLPESHLVRSVLRTLEASGMGKNTLTGIGIDGANFILPPDGSRIILSQGISDLPVKQPVRLAIHKAINNLYAAGGRPFGITLTIIMPADSKEKAVKSLIREAELLLPSLKDPLAREEIRILGGDTRLSLGVKWPIVTACAVGKLFCPDILRPDLLSETASGKGQAALYELKPDMDIIMTKWTGMEATWLLAENRYDELHTRFAGTYIDIGKEFGEHLSIAGEAAMLQEMGVFALHDVSAGGVYAALWEILEPSGLGCRVDIHSIPIKQETIEFAQFYNVNPYMLPGSGSLLAVVRDGAQAVEALWKAGIYARVIGKTKKDKARAICSGRKDTLDWVDEAKPRRRSEEEERYLTPPQGDEIYMILNK